MAIAVTTVELEKNNIVANVPIDCAMPVFDEGHIFVYFNKIRTLAVQGVDYDIVLNDPTYDDFDIIPTTALLLKINAQITLDPTDENVIFVRRELPLTNDFQETDAFFRAKLTDEIDRLTMTDQQLDDRLDNVEFTGADAAAILAAKTAAEVAAAAALVSETNAATSESNAAVSETNAATSAATATTQAGIATGAASTATTQAGIATGAASTATTQAGIATDAASTATTQAGVATAAAVAAAASYDSFDDRYLGAKITNPATDNDGDALITGAVYWNSVANEMRAWTGSQWVLALAAQGFATEGYADAAANDALLAANAYTDGEVAGAISTANTYTDGLISTLTATVATKADKSTQITGVGLAVNGGDLSADRTIDVPISSQTDAEEGTSNTGAMTPLRTKQAIEVLGVPALIGVQTTIIAVDAANQGQFLGPSGNRLFDSYDTTTYLDTGGSTGMDTSVVGLIKPTVSAGANQIPTMTAATTSGVTMSALTTDPQGGGALYPPWKAGDGASYATYAYGSAAGTTGWLKVDFGAGNPKTIASYMLRAPNVGFTRTPYDWKLQGSPDNSAWTDLDTRTNVTFAATQLRTFTIASPASYRYYQVIWTAVQPGNDGYSAVGQLGLYLAGSVSNMTALSTVLTASISPGKAKGFMVINPVDSITLNTDLTVEYSRNNGTNYTTATLVEKVAYPNGLKLLETSSLDISAQPSGTQMKYRIKTLNNKRVEIYDNAFYWS